jgi:hypothetical protein
VTCFTVRHMDRFFKKMHYIFRFEAAAPKCHAASDFFFFQYKIRRHRVRQTYST